MIEDLTCIKYNLSCLLLRIHKFSAESTVITFVLVEQYVGHKRFQPFALVVLNSVGSDLRQNYFPEIGLSVHELLCTSTPASCH